MPTYLIRDEQSGDAPAIRAVTLAAFKDMPYSHQTEAAIVDALRNDDALTISLVAVEGDEVVGHIAFSSISVGGAETPGWFGIGPLSVRPDRQRTGIGSALMRAGLARLERLGSKGCVLVGDPAYYERFGFRNSAALTYPGVPAENLLMLALAPEAPSGVVAFHPGFAAKD